MMNRWQRQRAAVRARRRTDNDAVVAPSKSILVQVVVALAGGDPTIFGHDDHHARWRGDVAQRQSG
jgi:hypothetical protein